MHIRANLSGDLGLPPPTQQTEQVIYSCSARTLSPRLYAVTRTCPNKTRRIAKSIEHYCAKGEHVRIKLEALLSPSWKPYDK
jgi:hypothetical protein